MKKKIEVCLEKAGNGMDALADVLYKGDNRDVGYCIRGAILGALVGTTIAILLNSIMVVGVSVAGCFSFWGYKTIVDKEDEI